MIREILSDSHHIQLYVILTEEYVITLGPALFEFEKFGNRIQKLSPSTFYDRNYRSNSTEHVRKNPFITVTGLSSDFGISYSTIHRRLNENGLFHYIPKQTHTGTKKSPCWILWIKLWYRVIFSVEKTFKSCNDLPKSVWRPKNQRYNPLYIQETSFSGRINCGVWINITKKGVGELCEITAHMNSAEYTSIFDEVFLPSLNITYGTSAHISTRLRAYTHIISH